MNSITSTTTTTIIPWELIALFCDSEVQVFKLTLLCKQSRNTIRNSDQVDQAIYQPLVDKVITQILAQSAATVDNNSKKLSETRRNKLMFSAEHIPNKSWFEILTEFYNEPFHYSESINLLEHEDFTTYRNCGGVTMIFCYEPCELIEIVLTKSNQNNAISMIFHKFLFIMSVLVGQVMDECRKDLPPINVKFAKEITSTPVQYGKLLLYLASGKRNDFCELSCQDVIEYSVRLDQFSKAKPNKFKLSTSNDIFKLCENPPYGITDKESFNLSQIRKDLYGNYKDLESFDWQSHLSHEWSQFWEAGEEWWGVHAHS